MEKRGKRGRFTAEYKAEAVKRLSESGKGMQEVADELGVHVNQLRTWRNEQRAVGSAEALVPRSIVRGATSLQLGNCKEVKMDEGVGVGVGPAERAPHAGGDGPTPEPRRRMSARRKQEAVLRLLRGEDLELVSRELGVTAAELSGWRDQFLALLWQECGFMRSINGLSHSYFLG